MPVWPGKSAQIGFPRIPIDFSVARQDQYLVHADKPHYCRGKAVTKTADQGEPCETWIPFRKPPGEYIYDQKSKWKGNGQNLQPFRYPYSKTEDEPDKKENKSNSKQVDMRHSGQTLDACAFAETGQLINFLIFGK